MQSLPLPLAKAVAAKAGCRLVRSTEWKGVAGDTDAIGYEFACPNRRAKLQLLDLLASVDAKKDPRVSELALLLARETDGTPAGIGAALHAFVKRTVRFQREGAERFVDTWRTVTVYGVGDCDDSARAVVALARAVGLRARLVTLGRKPESGHVVASLWDGARWQWAETTLPGALWGEHPYDARDRLKAQGREDLQQ